MVRSYMAVCIMLLSVTVSAIGCGDARENVDTTKVSGTITLDGKPLAGTSVHFIGEGGKFVGVGTTDPEGKYTLDRGSIPGEKGAMPGTNQVYLSMGDSASEEPPIVFPAPSAAPQPKKGLIPAKYTDPTKPALTFDVPERGTESADFELSSK